MQALGNDFVIVEAAALDSVRDLGELTREMCDRHFGAGADGLVVVDSKGRGGTARWSSRIFNSDGGEAEVSGNGTRCVAAYVAASGRWPRDAEAIAIETLAGVKLVRRVEREEGAQHLLEMEMGVPALASGSVPITIEPPMDRVVGYELALAEARFPVTAISVGNPHCSVFVADVGSVDIRLLGPSIEHHPLFPQRVNVEFVEVVDRTRLRVVFWERGAGETLSSGTGATAATVAAVLNGLAERSVTVETPAGDLHVTWSERDGIVRLAGPAELVYAGVWRPRGVRLQD